MVKVLDIDWAASDKPVLATQDGCLRIMDMILATSYSPVLDYELEGGNFCFFFFVSFYQYQGFTVLIELSKEIIFFKSCSKFALVASYWLLACLSLSSYPTRKNCSFKRFISINVP
jgi:hypothetical protein